DDDGYLALAPIDFADFDFTEDETSLLADGAILAYIKADGAWNAIPGAVITDEGASFTMYGFRHAFDGTLFYCDFPAIDAKPAFAKKTYDDLKIVFVPHIASSSTRMASVDWKNYEEVRKALGFKN